MVGGLFFSTNIWTNVFAQDKTITQDVDLWVLAQAVIQSISLQSCDGQPLYSVLSWTIRPNQTKDFCMAFINSSTGDITLEYWFTDSRINLDHSIACVDEMDTGAFFSSVLEYWTSVVVVPANGFAVKNISLKAPMTWLIQWCIAYKSPDYLTHVGMFDIVVRKSEHVNLLVSWKKYWLVDEVKDFFVWLKNNRSLWIWIIVILGLLFLYTLIKPSSHKQQKHKK